MASKKNDKTSTPETGAEDVDNLFVGSVAKAFRVLEAFGQGKPMMGFSQIAREVGLEKSAAQRAAHTLWKLGYLDKVGPAGEYRLTKRCLDLGHAFRKSNRIVECAEPYLRFLRRKTDASINLTMLDGPDSMFIIRYTNSAMLSNDLGGGLRMPAWCTATGVAMLSALDDEQIRVILSQSDLKPVMPGTIWETDKIMERIHRSREEGYVLGVEEDFASDITIACAVRDGLTGEIAAIGASYSSETTSVKAVMNGCRQLMMSTAQEIEAKLMTL